MVADSEGAGNPSDCIEARVRSRRPVHAHTLCSIFLRRICPFQHSEDLPCIDLPCIVPPCISRLCIGLRRVAAVEHRSIYPLCSILGEAHSSPCRSRRSTTRSPSLLGSFGPDLLLGGGVVVCCHREPVFPVLLNFRLADGALPASASRPCDNTLLEYVDVAPWLTNSLL